VVDIKTSGVKPLRTGFTHLIERFGDKRPPNRYQEATYDLQPTVNFHYKPTWETEGERDLYDARRTTIVMNDWYDLKDPRQYYYGAWTMTRAKQQGALDQQIEFVTKRDLLGSLPDQAKAQIVWGIVPLRHYEWGANTVNSQVGAYGFGTAITSPAMMQAMDRLGMAQHLSRVGLFTDGNTGDSLDQAHGHWMNDADWQGLREQVETLFVTRDWFEAFVAQNLVADSYVYPLFFSHFEAQFTRVYGASLSILTDYLLEWQKEVARWVDAVIKTAAKEGAENQQLLETWVSRWRAAFEEAVSPLAVELLGGDEAEVVLDEINADINKRIAKLGVA